jgi:AraC-like DNA-binding protein
MLRSRDLDEARSYNARAAVEMDLPGAARYRDSLDLRLNGVFLPGIWLGYAHYSAPVEFGFSPWSSPWLLKEPWRTAPSDDYWLFLPLRGRMEATISGEVYESDERHAVLLSPTAPSIVRAGPEHVRLGLIVRGEALKRHLDAMLDRPAAAALRFAPALRTDGGHGRRLKQALRWAAGEFERSGALGNPPLAARLESFVIEALLLFQPHNYSDALKRCARGVAPRDVKRAKDYIEASLRAPITLVDLAAVCGVPGRTLLKHFSDHVGVPPMRYARRLRLERARAELESGGAERVADAARRWRFAHVGRFSIEYRRQFGESPSTTLARARRRASRGAS